MVYIVQYNNCGLKCEGSDDYRIASVISQNRCFRRPHSHLTPLLQQTPTSIRMNLTLLETRIPGLHFCHKLCEALYIFEQFCLKIQKR